MVALLAQARQLAGSDEPVLILGETGAGKEIVARALHDGGPRAAAPFVALNCGAIAPTLLHSRLFGHERGAFTGAARVHRGVFERAAGGTVFLDEVGELDADAQATLLRVLEEKAFERVGGEAPLPLRARVVAATNRDLHALVEGGQFRADLLFRLDVVTLYVPPLRRRPDDVVPLAQHFLARAAPDRPLTFTRAALAHLAAYPWPGNVRELRNAVHRAVALTTAPVIDAHDLSDRIQDAAAARAAGRPVPGDPDAPPRPDSADPFAGGPGAAPAAAPADALPLPALRDNAPLPEQLADVEKRLILRALRQADYNQADAAERLGVPRRTLVYKIAQYGISTPRPKRRNRR
jgi:DNA-binding NtrC family response regulator